MLLPVASIAGYGGDVLELGGGLGSRLEEPLYKLKTSMGLSVHGRKREHELEFVGELMKVSGELVA